MMVKFLMVLATTLLLASCGSSPSSPSPPDPPALVSPADGDSLEGKDVIFSWEEVPGATLYHHQIASDSTMEDAMESEVPVPYVTLQPGLTGVYWWRARAVTPDGLTGWSPVWSFFLLNPCAD